MDKRGKIVEMIMNKLKIQLPIFLIFAEEKYSQLLLEFLEMTDVSRVNRVGEEVENSDYKELSDWGV